jgi:hypothetical protein
MDSSDFIAMTNEEIEEEHQEYVTLNVVIVRVTVTQRD